jgi:hypothetical protein
MAASKKTPWEKSIDKACDKLLKKILQARKKRIPEKFKRATTG